MKVTLRVSKYICVQIIVAFLTKVFNYVIKQIANIHKQFQTFSIYIRTARYILKTTSKEISNIDVNAIIEKKCKLY